jgi:hypothetical protein
MMYLTDVLPAAAAAFTIMMPDEVRQELCMRKSALGDSAMAQGS